MNLTNLKSLFTNNGCKKVYVKTLSPNDNSKNQVYIGGNFEILNILPISEIVNEEAGDWNKERFKAKINFSWINNEGLIFPAPKGIFLNAQPCSPRFLQPYQGCLTFSS